MKLAYAVAIVGGLAMGGALVYGFGFGGGWGEVALLMRYPWFVVSLVDVYVGFALFACWVACRERPLVAALWILLIMTLGNLVACIYAISALRKGKPLPLSSPGARTDPIQA